METTLNFSVADIFIGIAAEIYFSDAAKFV